MQILVNQEPLNYTLEHEECLGEVVDGIAEWLRSGNYEITAINVDEQSIPIHDRAHWQDTHLESVSTLSVEALPLSQVEQTTVAAIADYCTLLQRAIEEANETAVRDLALELPYVKARLQSIVPELFAGSSADELLSDAALEAGKIPQGEELLAVRGQLQSTISLLDVRLREYTSPERELALSLGQLAASVSSLGEVPVQLQTGDEGAAMKTVIVFTEQLSRIIRLLPLVNEPDFDLEAIRRFASDLTPHLLELQKAFEMHDSVLIGDLLEYEIAPRVAELQQLFPAAVVQESTEPEPTERAEESES